MDFFDLLLAAFGISFHAFVVAVCKGLAAEGLTFKNIASVGLWAGGAHMLMPVIGFYSGMGFHKFIDATGHWFSFLVLLVVGAYMILEHHEIWELPNHTFSVRVLLPLALADSVDIIPVGFEFDEKGVNIFKAAVIIGVSAFIMGALGVVFGKQLTRVLKHRSKLIGGVALIVIGCTVLLKELGGYH